MVLTRLSRFPKGSPGHLASMGCSDAGFTLIDLVTVLAVLALLVVIQMPAIAYNKNSSRQIVCADNLRQLAVASAMFADDNQGRLVGNQAAQATNKWVHGWLDYSLSGDNTNLTKITTGTLYPYSQATEIYRCPEDVSVVPSRGLRVRSYAMNSWLGEDAVGWYDSPSAFQVQTNVSQIRQPDQTFVFTEEHPDSINDGVFFIDPDRTGSSARFVDF